MIFVTKMDKQEMYLNPDHIISIEETPDTVIALFNGHHFIVRECASVIIDRIISFRAKIARRSNVSNAISLRRNRKSFFMQTSFNNRLHSRSASVEQTSSPIHFRDI